MADGCDAGWAILYSNRQHWAGREQRGDASKVFSRESEMSVPVVCVCVCVCVCVRARERDRVCVYVCCTFVKKPPLHHIHDLATYSDTSLSNTAYSRITRFF